jgi:hypothetical protein
VHSHARANHQDAFVAQWRKSFAQRVMLCWIFRVEERDLHHWYIEWVLLWIKRHQKRSENAMV